MTPERKRERNRKAVHKYRFVHKDEWPEIRRRISRRFHLKKTFGISEEEYTQMLLKQNGVCAICGEAEKRRNLAIDHDHHTGKIRALLCMRCNVKIDWFNKHFDKAVQYLGLKI